MLALGKARLAQPPARTLPTRMEDPWYDADHQVRRVRWNGMIKWRGEEIFIGEALAGEVIGLAEHESGGRIARFSKKAPYLFSAQKSPCFAWVFVRL